MRHHQKVRRHTHLSPPKSQPKADEDDSANPKPKVFVPKIMAFIGDGDNAGCVLLKENATCSLLCICDFIQNAAYLTMVVIKQWEEVARQAAIAPSYENTASSLPRPTSAYQDGGTHGATAAWTEDLFSSSPHLHQQPLHISTTDMESVAATAGSHTCSARTVTTSGASVSHPASPAIHTSNDSSSIVEAGAATESSRAATPSTTPASPQIKGKFRFIHKAKQALKGISIRKLINHKSFSCYADDTVAAQTAKKNRK